MLTGYTLSCTLGGSVLGIGSGVARFLMTAEYATYRYLRCIVNVMLLLSQLSVSLEQQPKMHPRFLKINKPKISTVKLYFGRGGPKPEFNQQ